MHLIKPGIEAVQAKVPLPIAVYDDVLARRAVAVTPEGGRIAIAAMHQTPLEPAKKAVLAAAAQAGKTIAAETICLDAARMCLEETGRTDLADSYVERFLREHQAEYGAFVIPQVPLTRIMCRLRDLRTPVFDSMEPFVDELAGVTP